MFNEQLNSSINIGNTWPCAWYDKLHQTIVIALTSSYPAIPTSISDQCLLKFNLYPDIFYLCSSFHCWRSKSDSISRPPPTKVSPQKENRFARNSVNCYSLQSLQWAVIRKVVSRTVAHLLELIRMEFAFAIWTTRWKWLHCNRKCPLNFDLRSDTEF